MECESIEQEYLIKSVHKHYTVAEMQVTELT